MGSTDPKESNVFLVGPMGAGKTTVGRELAKALGREFRDSDREIELRTGVEIPLIFELEGEAGFRQREKTVLDELTQLRGIVLATGGGAVLDPDNRRHLSSRGFVVWLHADLDDLLLRTSKNRKRPLLQTADPRARLEGILHEREPLYREIADLVLDTGGNATRAVVKAILDRLQQP